MTEFPIASASIGQVYKAKLLDGRDVAVKVQRPRILNDISLDLYLLKAFSPIQTKLTNPRADDVDIAIAMDFIDEWGKGLVAEIDYKLEAENTRNFLAAMKSRGLNAVTAPIIISELSGSRVLVTEWIEGTRLDKDVSPDIPRLCGVAINAYLTMLLDTGVLHCDPHPGNLLRTTDGRLCILDWGMTLKVPR
jgi:predicted unusual protein kinase regulating ubiquinone biosynthesis (AarF/ABC1/UbiB family)